MKRLVLYALVGVLLPAEAILAGGPCSGVKGGCGRSSYRSSARGYSTRSSGSGGAVHVQGYYRRDGTYVEPHTRRSQCSGCGTASSSLGSSSSGSSSDSDSSFSKDILPRKPRTTARTTARTRVWNGTSSSYDDEEEDAAEDDVDVRQLAPPVPAPIAKYVVHMVNGSKTEIRDYREDATTYRFVTMRSGTVRFPKEAVLEIEPIMAAVRE
jgi:hypothetical protein